MAACMGSFLPMGTTFAPPLEPRFARERRPDLLVSTTDVSKGKGWKGAGSSVSAIGSAAGSAAAGASPFGGGTRVRGWATAGWAGPATG